MRFLGLKYGLLLSICGFNFVSAEPRSKPVVLQQPRWAALQDLRSAWQAASVVARVRITKSHVNSISSDPRFLPLVHTEHDAVIIEPFKGDLEKGASILFRQTAGRIELADKIVVVDGAEPLESGREYFVFVAEAGGVHRLVGDAEGAFMLRNGEVFGQGRGELSRRTQRLGVADFVRAISYLADSERKRERPK